MPKPEINIEIKRSIKLDVDKNRLEEVVRKVLEIERSGTSVELGLLVTDDKTVRKLNRMYRGEDETTDVLSFQMISKEPEMSELPFISAPDGIRHLGEVVISYPQAVKQAQERAHGISREVALLIVHGTLHLLGYDHESADDELRMREKESQILSSLEVV